MNKQYIICHDLEGVFTPEIWIEVAKKTGIEKLKLTTRDIDNYEQLMKMRLQILKENNLKLKDITDVIQGIEPLEGSKGYLAWLSEIPNAQYAIISDTFQEFARPLMIKLGNPFLFCNSLEVLKDGTIVDYHIRQEDGKRKVVEGLQTLGYKVIAIGDSYNDIPMLNQAEHGILFNPPRKILKEINDFPITYNYNDCRMLVEKRLSR